MDRRDWQYLSPELTKDLNRERSKVGELEKRVKHLRAKSAELDRAVQQASVRKALRKAGLPESYAKEFRGDANDEEQVEAYVEAFPKPKAEDDDGPGWEISGQYVGRSF